MICSVTGTMRTATLATISQVSSAWYPSIILFMGTKRGNRCQAPISPAIPFPAVLLDGVDLSEDLVGADLLGVALDHRIDGFFQLRTLGERDALQLPRFFERLELLFVLARLDLPAIGARFLARTQHCRLQSLIERAEGLAGEAERPDGDRVLRHGEIRPDLVELHLLDAGSLVLARLDDAVLDGVVDLVVGDDGRRHAGGGERTAPDRRALHADLETFQVRHGVDRLRSEDVARAAARVADQHDVGLLRDLVGN